MWCYYSFGVKWPISISIWKSNNFINTSHDLLILMFSKYLWVVFIYRISLLKGIIFFAFFLDFFILFSHDYQLRVCTLWWLILELYVWGRKPHENSGSAFCVVGVKSEHNPNMADAQSIDERRTSKRKRPNLSLSWYSQIIFLFTSIINLHFSTHYIRIWASRNIRMGFRDGMFPRGIFTEKFHRCCKH